MTQTDARGSEMNSKVKLKIKKKSSSNTAEVEKDKILMTKEDEDLLRNVNDGEESDVDFNDDEGGDIGTAEICGFIKELGIIKYRPDVNDPDNDEDTASGSNVTPQKISEDREKTKKKKKSKLDPDDAEIKDEPGEHNPKSKPGKKNKSEKIKEEKKILSAQESASNEVKEEKEKKPDLKAIKAAMSYMKVVKKRTFLLLKPGESWREEEVRPISKIGPEDKLVKEAMVVAERIVKEDAAQYTRQKESGKRSEARWMKAVLVSGTLSDKIAALTLQIQESPVHNIACIDSLLSMAGKKGRREAMLAVDTIKDLFMTGLLPDNRKLRYFHQFPLYELWKMTSGNVDQRDKLLLIWYFEDILKKRYSQFIKIIGEMSFDTLKATKEKAVRTVHELLCNKPEQEHVLLPMLVNKVGDHNLNNKASYLLIKLVEEHPNMKGVIVKEICQLMYRPNISDRAQYNAICFLTQLRLNMEESKLATELIKIYISFFQSSLKKKVVDTKIMSALLTGVNRAYVYASEEISEVLGEMNEIYKMLPNVSFQTSVQALMLLYHITDNDSSTRATRFYTALYRKLNDPGLETSTKHSIFLNLLFKSMKRDSQESRILAFIKRTLQVYSHHPAHIVCGVLILLSQIIEAKPSLLNLSSKAQAEWDPSKETENIGDEEERFVDLPIPEEFKMDNKSYDAEVNGDLNQEASATVDSAASSIKSSWIHRTNKQGQKECNRYDPHHRNPLFCRAELECLWEVEELTKHFHPTVSLYASMLLKGESIEYNGDPLADYTLIRFLDRFVYKNPKKPANLASVGAPQHKEVSGIRSIPVNSKEYLKQRRVPEDELFYMKYFTQKEKLRAEKEDDADSVEDEEFDQYLDKFMDGEEEDFGNLDLDFARDSTKAKSKGKKGEVEESESDEDEDDDEMDFEDDEMAAEFKRELEGLEEIGDDDEPALRLGHDDEDDFNEEDVEFSADENDTLGSMMAKPTGKGKRKAGEQFLITDQKAKKKKKRDGTDLFASAEEFSHLLEEGIESGNVSLGGLNQMMNQDKAAQKQLDWEEKRDKWINNKGRPIRTGKKGKKSFGQGSKGKFSHSGKSKAKISKKK